MKLYIISIAMKRTDSCKWVENNNGPETDVQCHRQNEKTNIRNLPPKPDAILSCQPVVATRGETRYEVAAGDTEDQKLQVQSGHMHQMFHGLKVQSISQRQQEKERETESVRMMKIGKASLTDSTLDLSSCVSLLQQQSSREGEEATGRDTEAQCLQSCQCQKSSPVLITPLTSPLLLL